MCRAVLSCFSRVRLFVTLWAVANRLLCPGDSSGKKTGMGCHALLQGIKPMSLMSPALACGFFTTSAT